jgi:hypothetical protein
MSLSAQTITTTIHLSQVLANEVLKPKKPKKHQQTRNNTLAE